MSLQAISNVMALHFTTHILSAVMSGRELQKTTINTCKLEYGDEHGLL